MTESRRDPIGATASAEPTSTLVLESVTDTGSDATRRRLVAPVVRRDSRLLCVGTSSPREAVYRWISKGEDPPSETTIVTVGEETRGGTSAETVTSGRVRVEPVRHPGNLTELGITITDTVTEWDGAPGVVCFDALTTLLQYAELNEVYQFLHVLVARLEGAGVASFYRIDVNAHEEQTIATLRQLFDSVARIEAGGVSLKERSV